MHPSMSAAIGHKGQSTLYAIHALLMTDLIFPLITASENAFLSSIQFLLFSRVGFLENLFDTELVDTESFSLLEIWV